MIVEQAIYGVVRGGHGLRAASGDQRLAGELASRLDLPDTAPPGAEWSPYVSGFPYGEHYVLARTFSDPNAGRAGMVLTHALIAPLEAIVAIEDLRPLVGRLMLLPEHAPAEVANFAVELSDGLVPPTADLTAAAVALVIRAAGPVVRIGSAGFEDLVAALWSRLWPALRCRFSFRLSFGPGDIVENSEPALVCTPASLIGRWQQHRIIGRTGDTRPLAGAMLDGSDSGTELRTFADRIGAELTTFDELSLLEQAYRMVTARPEMIGHVLVAVRLVERLSPDPKRGETEKQVLLNRFVAALAQAQTSDILALRNVSLLGFSTSQQIWRGLEGWSEHYGFPPGDDTNLLFILREALLNSEARDEWRRAVSTAVTRAARDASSTFAAGFWRWAQADRGISAPLLALVDPDEGMETRLVEAAPTQLVRHAVEPILSVSADRRLYALHAVVAGAALPPIEAARLQCKVQSAPDAAAMRLALRRATPAEILDCAIDIGDERIVRVAGEVVAKTPSLLAGRDLAADVNRSVWSIALGINAEAWRGPTEPRLTFHDLLLDVIANRRIPPGLVEQLSGTPLAALTCFGQRAELWAHVDGTTRDRLLGATADAWLEQVTDGDHAPAIETELQERILRDPKLDRLLDQLAGGQISDGLRVMSALPDLEENRFRRWIEAADRKTRAFTAQDAELIGRLIAARRWRATVGDFITLCRAGRDDLKPILRACIDLVGFWDRWSLNLSSISNTEKWDSFIRLAADLYPSGPDQENLWERAGGRDADLSHFGSGIGRWREAMRRVQRGKSPDIAQLIREMRRDYEGNAQLRLLAEDPTFKGR